MADTTINHQNGPDASQQQQEQEQPVREGEAGDTDNEYSQEPTRASAEDGTSQAGSPGNSAVGNGLSGDSESEFHGSKLSASPDGTGHVGDDDMKPDLAEQIREDMEVVDGEGEHLGTVDCCEGGQIKLTKADSPDDQHHFIALDRVENVESGKVTIRSSMGETFGQNGS